MNTVLNPVSEDFDSNSYWRNRYLAGHNSGTGSYGRLADYKAQYINALVAREGIVSVIEFGSGDGNQCSLFDIQLYLGLDVSAEVVARCNERFLSRKDWRFESYKANARYGQFDLSMSIDVIFHLVEDSVFELYLGDLFRNAGRFVLIYSSDMEERSAPHVRHRKFTSVVSEKFPGWELVDNPIHPFAANPNEDWRVTTPARFYLYRRRSFLTRGLAGIRKLLRSNRT